MESQNSKQLNEMNEKFVEDFIKFTSSNSLNLKLTLIEQAMITELLNYKCINMIKDLPENLPISHESNSTISEIEGLIDIINLTKTNLYSVKDISKSLTYDKENIKMDILSCIILFRLISEYHTKFSLENYELHEFLNLSNSEIDSICSSVAVQIIDKLADFLENSEPVIDKSVLYNKGELPLLQKISLKIDLKSNEKFNLNANNILGYLNIEKILLIKLSDSLTIVNKYNKDKLEYINKIILKSETLKSKEGQKV